MADTLTIGVAERRVADAKRALTNARNAEYMRALQSDQNLEESIISEFRAAHPLDPDERRKFVKIIDDLIQKWGAERHHQILTIVKLCIKP